MYVTINHYAGGCLVRGESLPGERWRDTVFRVQMGYRLPDGATSLDSLVVIHVSDD